MGDGVRNSCRYRSRVPGPPLTPLGPCKSRGSTKILAGDWEGLIGLGWELRWGPSGAAAPPQQASFIVSGKQMTERKPSPGDEKCSLALASADLGRGGRKTPSPSSGSVSTQHTLAMWVPGCGGEGCSPACALQEKSPPTGLGRAQHKVDEHANRCK